MADERFALLRPAPVSLVGMSVGLAILSFIYLMMPTSMDGPWRLIIPFLMALPGGLLANSLWNQGTWLSRNAIVLEAVVGRATVNLEDIQEVHIDEALTTLGVQTSTHYVVQSIATPIPLGGDAHVKGRVGSRLRSSGVACVWHAGAGDVYRVAKATSPFMVPGAIRGTLSRPLVWGSMLGWLAYGVLLSFI